MCLIVYKPAGVKLDWKLLRRGHADNPDGAGYLLHDGAKVYHGKGLWDWRTTRRTLRGLTDFELVVHFRWATHGAVNEANCHPFFGTGWGMVHNGIVAGYGSVQQSDTAAFAAWLDNEFGADAPELSHHWDWQTGWSKFVFARPGRPMVIVGEEFGQWRKGCWYSNTNSFPTVAPPRRSLITDHWEDDYAKLIDLDLA